MRHGKKVNHLSRKSAHRKAMLSNMATSLIMHKRITTTLAKAKALRVYVEPIITRSKDDSTHSRRVVFSHLQSKEAVTLLFRDISTKVADRPGGYTRIIKLGLRLGDNAEMAMIELVDFNLNLLGEKAGAKAKGTRRGRRGSKKAADEVAGVIPPEAKSAKVEAKKEVEPVAPAVVEATAQAEEIADVVEEPGLVAEAEEPISDETIPEEETKA
ncbi:MAG: 50S ribosomal protein L17 [Bacteroidales bacterium]|nr:50S ribosomal protein L17 [Bacteroidales bacterium]